MMTPPPHTHIRDITVQIFTCLSALPPTRVGLTLFPPVRVQLPNNADLNNIQGRMISSSSTSPHPDRIYIYIYSSSSNHTSHILIINQLYLTYTHLRSCKNLRIFLHFRPFFVHFRDFGPFFAMFVILTPKNVRSPTPESHPSFFSGAAQSKCWQCCFMVELLDVWFITIFGKLAVINIKLNVFTPREKPHSGITIPTESLWVWEIRICNYFRAILSSSG